MIPMRPATWLDHCRAFSAIVLDAFCHALQSPQAAAVFSPSLGVCLLLLIWGIAPGIELHRFRHRSQKVFCWRHSGLWSSSDLLLAAFACLHTEYRHGKEEYLHDYFLPTFKSFARVRPCVQVRKFVCVREKEKQREKGRESERGRYVDR